MAVRDSPRIRMNILGLVALALFAALFARLWSLQVLTVSEFQEQAVANITREFTQQAPRGRIFDAEGRVLVDNEVTLRLSMDPTLLNVAIDGSEEREELAFRLAREISSTGRLTKAQPILEQLERTDYGPFERYPLVDDVTEEFSIWVAERSHRFPGLLVEKVHRRVYPYGPLAAHILGYVGPITEDELANRENAEKVYALSDEIGKTGVERVYENFLRGTPGRRAVEVNSVGNVTAVLEEIPPSPGIDLQLTIDIDVQAFAERQLEQQLFEARLQDPSDEYGVYVAPAGALVVLDPDGSRVVAMASYPSYDPRDFAEGISQEEFEAYQDPLRHAPLNNRAIQGLYAPGSTFKPFTSYAGIDSGLIGARGDRTVNSRINDPGYYELDNCSGNCRFTNANESAYGAVNLSEALTVSSDVYYYSLADAFDRRAGFDKRAIQQTAEAFGFGSTSGVALPFEQAGLVPTPELKAERHAENPEAFPNGEWLTGDTLNTSIGQGDMLASPLQMANAYAVWANLGTLYAPAIAEGVIDPATGEFAQKFEHRVLKELYFPADTWQPIITGLLGVTQNTLGTAFDAFEGFPTLSYPIAGKTGTAEVFGKNDFAVFASFGPWPDPDYVVVAVLEEAGFGGEQAAPLVRRMWDAFAFDGIPEVLPVDPTGTVLATAEERQAAAEAALLAQQAIEDPLNQEEILSDVIGVGGTDGADGAVDGVAGVDPDDEAQTDDGAGEATGGGG